ncbi:Aminotransferase-like, plant mobile domain [Sesbania bispinosa]|nr:Aminotransferase-like, plant mobile domain [Sesbania bispinosa]
MADGGGEKVSHSPDEDVWSLFRKDRTMVFGGIDGRQLWLRKKVQEVRMVHPAEVEDRGTLKVITHGRKLRRPENDYVRDIVDDSGLGPLVEVSEKTITLDDVNNLLHIPVHGRFFFLPSLGKDEAKELLVTLLGVSYSDAHEEIEYTRGPSVKLSWLRSVYENKVEENRLSYASRAYLLHLVGCTIFTDKIALAYLYEQFNEASLHQTRQLAGYPTPFQAWILEHFPHVTHGERSPNYVEGMPLSRRLRLYRPMGDVVNVRQYLDRIRHSDIIWTSYIFHRAHRSFHDVCWYYGYITSGGAPLPHLPDRVLQQYGHVQSIPPSPYEELPVPPSADVHAHFIHYHDHLLDKSRRGPHFTHAGECTQGYLDWFQQVSYPYLIPHDDKVHDPLPRRVPTIGGSQDIPSGTPEDSSHQVLFAGITERLQALLSTDMCVPGSTCEMLTHEMLRMASKACSMNARGSLPHTSGRGGEGAVQPLR